MRPYFTLAIVLLALVTVLDGSRVRAQAQEALGLETITLSPSPSEWPIDPTHPEDPPERGMDSFYIALYDDDGSRREIPEVSISMIPSGGATGITINGVEVAVGESITFAWEARVPWLDIDITLTGLDGSNSSFTIALINNYLLGGGGPSVGVDPDNRIVTAVHLTSGNLATMTVRTAPGGTVLATASSAVATLEEHSIEDGAYWELHKLGIPIALKPGMEVSVTDGEVTVTHVVIPLTVDEVDFENDTIRGSGEPGAAIALLIFPEVIEQEEDTPSVIEPFQIGLTRAPEEDLSGEGDPVDHRFIVDSTGRWEVDLSPDGVDLTETSEIHVQSSADSDAHSLVGNPNRRPPLYDPLNLIRGTTESHWPLPALESGLITIMGIDMIVLEGIQPGIVARAVVRTEPGGEIVFTGTASASVDGEAGWAKSEITVSLMPGMEVSVSWGETTITNVLPDLAVEEVNAGLDVVRGSGPPGESIFLIIGDFNGAVFTVAALETEVVIDTDGLWSHDFKGEFDVQVGMLAIGVLQKVEGAFGATGIAGIVPTVEETGIESSDASDFEVTVVRTTSIDGATLEVEVPAGALPTGSSVEIASVVNRAELIEQAVPPEGADIVLGFRINATAKDGSVISGGFGSPVTIRFEIDSNFVPEGVPPEDIMIAFWNGVEWTALGEVTVTENPDGTIALEMQTDHFTFFGIFHDPSGSIQAGPVDPIDEIAISSLRSNLGLNLTGPAQEITLGDSSLSPAQEITAGESSLLRNPVVWGVGLLALLTALAGAAFFFRRGDHGTSSGVVTALR